MLSTISLKLAQLLTPKGSDPEDTEVLAYGLECFLSTFFTFGSLLIMAAIMKVLPWMLIWLAFWFPLRSFLGGYHASSHGRCYAGSMAVGFINMLLLPVLPAASVPFLLLTAIIVVFRIAPVTHPNHPLSTAKKIRMRKYALITVSVEGLIVILLYFLAPDFSKVVISMFTAALLAVIGHFVNKQHY